MNAHAYWIVAGLVAIFGAALLGRRSRGGRPRERSEVPTPKPAPLQPGESYDTSVKLATVPNVPLADMWCQRLRAEGIEAFYKSGPYLAGVYPGASTNPSLPTEIWVGEHSVERARELFPELG